jgi:hypothetical protein
MTTDQYREHQAQRVDTIIVCIAVAGILALVAVCHYLPEVFI